MQKNIYALIFIILIFFDQILKYIIRHSGGFYICNANLAFGLNLYYLLPFVLVLIAILFLISVGNYKHKISNSKQIQNSKKQNTKLFSIWNFGHWNLFSISNLEFRIFPVILALAGAISNIIDRLYFSCVIDFIDLKFWPVFNLADVYITIGGIILLVNLFKKDAK